MCRVGHRCAAASSQGCGSRDIYETRKNNRTYRRDLANKVREMGSPELAGQIMKAKFVAMPELTAAAGLDPSEVSDASLPGLVKTHRVSAGDQELIRNLSKKAAPIQDQEADEIRPVHPDDDISGLAPEAYASRIFRIDNEMDAMKEELHSMAGESDEASRLRQKIGLFREDRDRLSIARSRSDAHLDYEWNAEHESAYVAEVSAAKAAAETEAESATADDEAETVTEEVTDSGPSPEGEDENGGDENPVEVSRENMLHDPASFLAYSEEIRDISSEDLSDAWDRFADLDTDEANRVREILTEEARSRQAAMEGLDLPESDRPDPTVLDDAASGEIGNDKYLAAFRDATDDAERRAALDVIAEKGLGDLIDSMSRSEANYLSLRNKQESAADGRSTPAMRRARHDAEFRASKAKEFSTTPELLEAGPTDGLVSWSKVFSDDIPSEKKAKDALLYEIAQRHEASAYPRVHQGKVTPTQETIDAVHADPDAFSVTPMPAGMSVQADGELLIVTDDKTGAWWSVGGNYPSEPLIQGRSGRNVKPTGPAGRKVMEAVTAHLSQRV